MQVGIALLAYNFWVVTGQSSYLIPFYGLHTLNALKVSK